MPCLKFLTLIHSNPQPQPKETPVAKVPPVGVPLINPVELKVNPVGSDLVLKVHASLLVI